MSNIDYERGLEQLRDIVLRQKPEALDKFSLFQFRLLECLQDGRELGYDPTTNVRQNRVLKELIQFAREHFGIEFIELCKQENILDILLWEDDVPTPPGNQRKSIMEIDGTQQRQLCEALLSAFPTRQDLEMMVSYGLNENLALIAGESNLRHTVFELIRWSMARGRLEELVVGALAQNSQNPQLMSVAKKLGLRNDQNSGRGFGTDENTQNSATYSSVTPTEIWTGGSEILIKGVKYVIHTPVEVKCASDNSALQQQAKALQVGTSRMVWLRQVQLRRATATASAWKDALEKEGRLIDTLAQNLPQRFPGYVDYESTMSNVTLVYSAVQSESWLQYFNPSNEPLNKQLTRNLLRSAVSLCDTLKPLHARKYAHRLLAPDKIFLIGGRTALLQDFGLATSKYESGEGPELYQAPEQTSSNRSLLGPYTDVYQLGMILYHFITGTIPKSPQQVLPLRTWNGELSVEQDAVLQRAIAFNVKERWQNAAEFSSALRKELPRL